MLGFRLMYWTHSLQRICTSSMFSRPSIVVIRLLWHGTTILLLLFCPSEGLSVIQRCEQPLLILGQIMWRIEHIVYCISLVLLSVYSSAYTMSMNSIFLINNNNNVNYIYFTYSSYTRCIFRLWYIVFVVMLLPDKHCTQ